MRKDFTAIVEMFLTALLIGIGGVYATTHPVAESAWVVLALLWLIVLLFFMGCRSCNLAVRLVAFAFAVVHSFQIFIHFLLHSP